MHGMKNTQNAPKLFGVDPELEGLSSLANVC
jgi:hypothetical protein